MRFKEVLKKRRDKGTIVYVSGITQKIKKAIIILVETDWVIVRTRKDNVNFIVPYSSIAIKQ